MFTLSIPSLPIGCLFIVFCDIINHLIYTIDQFQEDLGGELFSLGELFPSPGCAAKFLNFLTFFDDNVVNNFGSVQSSVGQTLASSAEEFWVAGRKDAGSEMYRYEGRQCSPLNVKV